MFQSLKNVTPRAATALGVVAVTAFLAVCLMRVGASGFADPNGAGFVAAKTAKLVESFGAGLWVLLLLPMAWGAIVYFEDKTPDLLLRSAGIVVFAVATSTLVGLLHGGLWAGQVGQATAHALAGLSTRLGGFGTALAWLIELALLATSFIFATDWAFHSLRRAGRAAAAQAKEIAVEKPGEVREETAAPTAREFVVDTPRAAVAAREMEEITSASSDELALPEDWAEHEEEGRTVIAAPTGYRGVEFLPPSDELAVPEMLQAPRFEVHEEPQTSAESAPPAGFEDEHFVATSDAAYFVETPDETSDTEELEDFASAKAVPPGEDEEIVADAVQALFEAVTTPAAESAAPASGIGLPADSPFADEFFAVDGVWPYAPGPSDGTSARAEMTQQFAPAEAAPAPARAPEAVEASEPAFEDEQIAIDEILVSRLPAEVFEEAAPLDEQPTPEFVPETMPVAATPQIDAPVVIVESPIVESAIVEEPPVVEEIATPTIAAPIESSPQLPLFADTSASEPTSAVATLPAIDLARLHAMELDPMFHDAVNAVLERGRASAVVLQRQLGIGYARGIRILDQMTAAGLAGPDTPTGAREIRVTKDAWTSFAR